MDWIVPSPAYSPSTGFHSVNTSGGSPAAISDSSFASPVALGMLDSVTWMPGWVALNLLTIWLSSVRVLPDHIVCQLRSTTPVDDEELPLVDAAGPPQAARAIAAQAASTAGTTPRISLALRRTARPGVRGPL